MKLTRTKNLISVLTVFLLAIPFIKTTNAQTFTDINAGLIGINRSSVAWGDYNNDGYLDVLLTGRDNSSNRTSNIYRNNGNGTFTDINAGLIGVYNGSVAWGDYNNDGYLDILLTGYTGSSRISKIYRNNGDGTFTDINAGLTGVENGSVAWGDYNNDGYLDILLTGYTGSFRTSRIYHNNGNGTFTNINTSLVDVMYSSVAWGDYNNDGYLDVLLTGHTGVHSISNIYRNNGNGTFTNINAGLTGVNYSSAVWGDYNNDGYLDVLLTGSYISKIYRNNGDGTFTDINAGLTGVQYSSVAWGDYNNDGYLDILLTGNQISKIYKNTSSTNLNTIPTAPTGLTSAHINNNVILRWNKATDAETPQDGLTYNVRIGSQPNGIDMYSPMADTNTGFRRIVEMGNAQLDTFYIINTNNFYGCQTYYYSVQAIDNAFAASKFSNESTFYMPLTIDAGKDTTISCGGSVGLHVTTNGNSYTWSPSIGLSDTSIYNPVAKPVQTTTYYVRVSSPKGCVASDSVIVYVNPLTADAGANQTITCGNTASLNVTTNCNGCSLSYAWSPSIGLNDTSIQNPVATPIQTTTYYVTVSSPEGCIVTDSVTIFVKGIDYPIDFVSDVQKLTSTPFTFQFNNLTPSINNYNFTWYFGDGNSMSSNNSNVYHTYDYNGLYTVSLIAAGIATGCTDTLIKTDYIYCTSGPTSNKPVAAFTGVPTSLYAGNVVNFSDNSTNNPTSWMWHFPGGSPSSSTKKNPSNILYDSVGTYNVQLIVSNVAGSDTLVKYDYISVNSTGINAIDENETINVYPNPFSNELIIELEGYNEEVSFKIVNSVGQNVYSGSVVKRTIINTSDLAAGVYVIKFGNNRVYKFRKIIKN